MTSLTRDFDSEAGTSTTSGRYGQVSTNDDKLPLEISSGNDDDTDTTLSLTDKYLQEKHQNKLRHWKESAHTVAKRLRTLTVLHSTNSLHLNEKNSGVLDNKIDRKCGRGSSLTAF